MFELVELDPMTGDEDHLVATGTFARLEREMAKLIDEVETEWDEEQTTWSAYRIQPAA